MSFHAPTQVQRYLIPKGSIAIDGVSLTVNGVCDDGFDVVLIPHTRQVVRLHEKTIGDQVNLEADLVGKYVERFVLGERKHQTGRVDLTLLKKAGFL